MSYKTPVTSSTDFGIMKVGAGLSVTAGVVSTTATTASNYGFFSSNVTQTNPVANAINIVTLPITGPASGISVVGGNAITVTNAGIYTQIFTIIPAKTSGGTSTISFWLRYNGTDIAASRLDLNLINTLPLTFTSGGFTLTMAAGSNIQMCWSSPDDEVTLKALPATTTPTRPSSASVKITLTRIG